MKKSINFFLFIVLFIASHAYVSDKTITSKVIESKNISCLLENDEANTLFAFDLDDTVFYGKNSLSRTNWFETSLKNMLAKGQTKEEAFKTLLPFYVVVQDHAKLRIIDNRLPQIFKTLKEKGSTLIGLTARTPALYSSTVEKLHSMNISFSKNDFLNTPYSFDTNKQVWLKDSIIFCNGSNKGKMLKSFLKQAKEKGVTFKKVIMIDDTKRHVIDVQNELSSLDIDYLGIHYTGAENKKLSFSNKQAKKDLKKIINNFISSIE
jgi:hypothetical protein